MRLGYSKSKNAISYYVYKTGYKNGKNTTVMVEKLGTDSQIREKYGVEDAEQWARAYIDELNRKEAEEKAKVMVTFSPAAAIPTRTAANHLSSFLTLNHPPYRCGP